MAMDRDRHGRGMRGPLVRPGSPLPPLERGRSRRAEDFATMVDAAVQRVRGHAPQALRGIRIQIEDVPGTQTWQQGGVPLAAGWEATEDAPARLVLFRHPLQHRANSRRHLARLTHRTLVEQLASLTGFPLETLAPGGLPDED